MLKKVLSYYVLALIILNNCCFAQGGVNIDDISSFVYYNDEPEGFEEFSQYWGKYDYAERKYQKYTYEYDDKKKNILIYNMAEECFDEFVKNPNDKSLEKLFYAPLDKVTVAEASLYDENSINLVGGNKEDEIINPVIVNDKNYLVYCSDEYFSQYDFPVVSDIKELDIDNIQKVLKKNNIYDKVEERVVIQCLYYPLVVWIKTENNIYLMEIKKPYNGINHRVKYVKNIYSVEEFQKQFTEKEGKLIIDGNEIGKGNVVFFKDYPLIKARVIWEYFSGKEVVWNSKDKSVSFWYNGEKIDFIKDEFGLYYYYKNGQIDFQMLFSPRFINNCFYWEYEYLDAHLKKMYSKELKVDIESKSVIIE